MANQSGKKIILSCYSVVHNVDACFIIKDQSLIFSLLCVDMPAPPQSHATSWCLPP